MKPVIGINSSCFCFSKQKSDNTAKVKMTLITGVIYAAASPCLTQTQHWNRDANPAGVKDNAILELTAVLDAVTFMGEELIRVLSNQLFSKLKGEEKQSFHLLSCSSGAFYTATAQPNERTAENKSCRYADKLLV